MNKIIFTLIIALLLRPLVIQADKANPSDAATWTVSPKSYQYSMTITGVLVFDGMESKDMNDKVAVFAGDDCRGVAQPIIFNPKTNKYIAYLLVYSNEPSNETLTVMLYDSSTKKIIPAANKMTFFANANYGFSDEPYLLTTSNQPLSITIDNTDVSENQISAVIGNLTTFDKDGISKSTKISYSFETGQGDADNSKFSISGNKLSVKDFLNYEEKPVYSARIKSDDGFGGKLSQVFQINAIDVNDLPTKLNISASTILENLPSGSTVGDFSTIDEDIFDIQAYSLVLGNGSTDNDKFYIEKKSLKSKTTFNYEEKNKYQIRVRTNDGEGGILDSSLVINILDDNDQPVNILLSNNKLAENKSNLTEIGTFSLVDIDKVIHTGDDVSYAFSTSGNNQNSLFVIDKNILKSNTKFDFEKQNYYTINVEAKDAAGITTQKQFVIEITDVNEAPTGISLSSIVIPEMSPVGTKIGLFDTKDPDSSGTYTYTLIQGFGDQDNSKFIIDGNILILAEILDYDAKRSYQILVKSTDAGGLVYQQPFTITIGEVNEAPLNITLSSINISENRPAGSYIGTIITSDPDNPLASSYTYMLVPGDGSAGNEYFSIEGSILKSAIMFDYEKQNSYSINISVDDGKGAKYSKNLLISVTNVNDKPSDIILSNAYINENVQPGSIVGSLSTIDQDKNDSHTYELISGNPDNLSFYLDGKDLKFKEIPDFETKQYYIIQLSSKDKEGETMNKNFTVSVVNQNDTPEIYDQYFEVLESLKLYEKIGTVKAYDEDKAQRLSFKISSGDDGMFAIDPYTGDIKLINSGLLDFEKKNRYEIKVTVEDNDKAEKKSSEATIMISVLDVNDPPQVDDFEFKVNENAPLGEIVGTVISKNAENVQNLIYSIKEIKNVSSNIFSIDSQTGEIKVAVSKLPEFEVTPEYQMVVEVKDNGIGQLASLSNITIKVIDAVDNSLKASNYFSPNNDGINDYWTIQSPEIYDGYELIIYNAAGEIVFRTVSYKNNWNGTLSGKRLPIDVYYYLLKSSDGKNIYKGSVTLMR